MKQDGLRYFTDTYLTSIGLMIFFIFFVLMLFWVFRKGSSSLYARLQNLPLDFSQEQGGDRER